MSPTAMRLSICTKSHDGKFISRATNLAATCSAKSLVGKTAALLNLRGLAFAPSAHCDFLSDSGMKTLWRSALDAPPSSMSAPS